MAIVVADIHGDIEKARAFLDYKPETLHVALGDYLDSFIEPFERQLECLQLLMESNAVLLLGNHEVHYLKEPLFQFAGYNVEYVQIIQEILEENIKRFKAAYAVDGWLLTHAGVHQGITAHVNDVDKLAKMLQSQFERYLVKRFISKHSQYRYQSIFWFNFLVEGSIVAPNIKQIFGHVEIRQPEVRENYIALDTTNFTNSCWLYDTQHRELVQLPLPPKIGRVRFSGGGWS
ncbi:MAG: metallophosphoesterase [Desulfuromonadales bacterium]|nr:metallophosphoesterase [Desulfuromonadales bacterium]